jgi:hypothetical protein
MKTRVVPIAKVGLNRTKNRGEEGKRQEARGKRQEVGDSLPTQSVLSQSSIAIFPVPCSGVPCSLFPIPYSPFPRHKINPVSDITSKDGASANRLLAIAILPGDGEGRGTLSRAIDESRF